MATGVDLKARLLAALDSVQGAGFCEGGFLSSKVPSLVVEGLGPVALPLSPQDAEALEQNCEVAPFGKKDRTLRDKDVRDTLQLGPEKLTIANAAEWAGVVADAVQRARRALGVPDGDNVQAQLYKLLLYRTGGHFKPHRDSEKDAGMFATLTIMLPSDYEGGELVLRHCSQEKTFDLAASNRQATCFAAFFADCEHTVMPVTKGNRLCLVYNLVLGSQQAQQAQQGAGAQPALDALAMIRPLLEEWGRDAFAPERLIYMLSHRYTRAGLSGLAALKGRDRAVAQLLLAAGRGAGLGLHAAIVAKHDQGEGGCWFEEDEEPRMGSVYTTDYEVSGWVPLLGERAVGIIDLDADPQVEIMQGEEYWRGMAASDSRTIYTGNEESGLELWYRNAALVLWRPALEEA